MHTLNALTLAEKIRRRDLTALEVTKHTLERITTDPNNCFLDTTPETALDAATALDAQLERGDCPSLLAGVPIAIDDTILVRGDRCTAGSRMLDTFKAPFSATVIEKIRAAGLIPIGRTNTDEFGVGNSGDTCWHGSTPNPRDPAATTGGAAAAIASRLVPLALCSDSIGAQRKHAALTGTVFLKPTYGRVSRFGLIAYVPSAEQIGAAAANIHDAAALLNIISGHDPRDGTSLPDTSEPPITLTSRNGLAGMRVGIATDWWTLSQQPDTLRRVSTHLSELDARVQEYALPPRYANLVKLGPLALTVIAAAEGCNNFSRYDGLKFGHRPQTGTSLDDIYFGSRSEGFGYEVKKTILLGSYVLAQQQYEKYYLQALKIRRLIHQHLTEALQQFDCLLLPVSPTLDRQKDVTAGAKPSLKDMLCTAPASLAGLPAVAGTAGIQLVAGSRGEQHLYDAWAALSG
ncbi:MAG: amidase family protein [Peptococcaceae bacterium]|nr:amidase family protein [Peptococcaceae bacterium]